VIVVVTALSAYYYLMIVNIIIARAGAGFVAAARAPAGARRDRLFVHVFSSIPASSTAAARAKLSVLTDALPGGGRGGVGRSIDIFARPVAEALPYGRRARRVPCCDHQTPRAQTVRTTAGADSAWCPSLQPVRHGLLTDRRRPTRRRNYLRGGSREPICVSRASRPRLRPGSHFNMAERRSVRRRAKLAAS